MKIEDVFYKLRPVLGKQIDMLWQEYLVADPPLQKTIEKVLRVQLARQLGETYQSEQVLLKPPPQELATGEYHAGSIHYGSNSYYGFGLQEQEFIQHIGIFGRSGSGKTNLAFLILKGLVQKAKPFLVFDWKRNYRDLLSSPDFKGLLVFTVGRDIVPFRFNPLIPPPGTPPKIWLKKLIEIMCHAYFLGEGVSVLLLRAIDSLYAEYGLYSGKAKGYPTMDSVKSWLLKYGPKGRERGWMESALRAVETLCFGEVGNVLNSGPAVDIALLLEKQAVLELDALTNADKTFLIESLLLWIHHYRLAEKTREKFKHAIIIEEAHHVLLRKKQEATGEETVTDVLLREIRELGESIICLDQHPSLISKPALGNTYTTFAFNLKHRGDLAMMQDCLLLDKEQTGYLGRLEVGWATVKLQGRWFFPFLVKIPLVKVEKGSVTDSVLKQKQSFARKLYSQRGCSARIPVIPGNSGLFRTQDTAERAIPHKGKLEKEKRNNGKNKGCTIKLTTQQRRLLKDIWLYPTSTITERYDRLRFSSRLGNSIQNSLLASSFISSSFVPLPSGRIKILILTDKGRKELGINTSESDRHGGAEHRYWCKLLAGHLRKRGYSVTKEAPIGGGKAVDILAVKNGKRIAFEIETGKSDAVANVKKCLKAGIDKVVVVATSSGAYKQLSSVLRENSHVSLKTGKDALHILGD